MKTFNDFLKRVGFSPILDSPTDKESLTSLRRIESLERRLNIEATQNKDKEEQSL